MPEGQATGQAVGAAFGQGPADDPFLQYLDTEDKAKDTLLDTKTIKGVTYKAYKRADGSLYVVNTDSGAVLEGSFADNGLGGTGAGAGGTAAKPPKDIVYKGDKAYREAANGALTRTPEFDLEPSKPASTAIRSEAVSRIAGQRPSTTIAPGPEDITLGRESRPGISREQFLSAADTPGVQAGELLGSAPSYLFNAERQGLPQGLDLPVTAGGVLELQPGTPSGLTPLPGELAPAAAQFGGAVGDVNLGLGFDPGISQMAGIQPTGSALTDVLVALRTLADRSRMMNDPVTADWAKSLGTSPEAAAQARMERSSPQWLAGMANPANPQTNLAPVLVNGQWMQPAGGSSYIAAPTSSFNSSRSPEGVSVRPIGRGGADLDEALGLQAAGDFFQSLTPEQSAGLFGGNPLATPAQSIPVTQIQNPTVDKNRFGSIQAAGGFSGVVNQPTNLTVGEGGQPEMVNVQPMGSGGMLGSANQGMQQRMPDWMSVAQGLVSRLLTDSRGRRKRPTGVMEMAGSYL